MWLWHISTAIDRYLFQFPNEIRNRFLSAYTVELSIYMSKTDSINTLKFIGRKYCCLTDVMDQLNPCHSFQVHGTMMQLLFNRQFHVRFEIFLMVYGISLAVPKAIFLPVARQLSIATTLMRLVMRTISAPLSPCCTVNARDHSKQETLTRLLAVSK